MRNYAYGARAPIQNADLVHQQLRLAHNYQKALTFVEIRRREWVENLYRLAAPLEWGEHAAAEAAVEKAILIVRALRSNHGEFMQPDEEMAAEKRAEVKLAKEALAAAKARQKDAKKAWYDARRRELPILKPDLTACDAAAYAARRSLYNAPEFADLYWATREKVNEACERSAKAALKAGTVPRLPKFDGGGVIAVRLQGGGLTMQEACGHDTQIQIELVNAESWQMAQRGRSPSLSREKIRWRCETCARTWSGADAGEKCRCGGVAAREITGAPRKIARVEEDSRLFRARAAGDSYVKSSGTEGRALGYALVRLRIGNENGRKPKFAAFPVVLHTHRATPPSARIKVAFVIARRVGPDMEWKFCLTIDDGEIEKKKEGVTLAVNLGWRDLEDGLRVAYAVGSDNNSLERRVRNGAPESDAERILRRAVPVHEELRVPPQFIAAMEQVRQLGEDRSRLFNAAKIALKAWLDERADEGEMPEMFDRFRQWGHLWRSPKHLVFLLHNWRAARFDGDAGMLRALERWRERDLHLWRYEAGLRERSLRMRKDWYRRIAADWAERYQTTIVTDIDLRVFAQRELPEQADDVDKKQRKQQRNTAPSELREAIKNACATRGAVFKQIKALTQRQRRDGGEETVGPTQRCHACGETSFFDARSILMHTCRCGAVWDQDYNHCMNLLASGEVAEEVPGALAPSVEGEGNGAEQPRGRWQKRRARKVELNVPETQDNS